MRTQRDPFLYTIVVRSTARKPSPGERALLYVRVSTEEQASHGASLASQETALIAEAERRGVDWEIVRDEGVSARSLNRPALLNALQRLDQGEATMLLAYRLDRLSRSVADFSSLLDRSHRRGWRLVVCDVDVDTGTPSGEFLVNVVAAAAQFERRLIGQRTREGMAQRRSEGVHLGRPAVLPTDVVDRIRDLRLRGASLRAIAEELNSTGVPTAHGGRRWHASTVSAVLTSVTACRWREAPEPMQAF